MLSLHLHCVGFNRRNGSHYCKEPATTQIVAGLKITQFVLRLHNSFEVAESLARFLSNSGKQIEQLHSDQQQQLFEHNHIHPVRQVDFVC
jgi:hypothetical protein